MIPSYHNTNNHVNAELLKAIEAATKQQDRVLLIFQAKNRPMSPSEVWQIYQTWFSRCPITSIRRAITNMTQYVFENYKNQTVPKLCKTDLPLRPGLYSRGENVWQLNTPNQ